MGWFGRRKQVEEAKGISKAKLLLGAAGLLLFIVGVKRSHRLDESGATVVDDGSEPPAPGTAAPADPAS